MSYQDKRLLKCVPNKHNTTPNRLLGSADQTQYVLHRKDAFACSAKFFYIYIGYLIKKVIEKLSDLMHFPYRNTAVCRFVVSALYSTDSWHQHWSSCLSPVFWGGGGGGGGVPLKFHTKYHKIPYIERCGFYLQVNI